MQPGVSTKSHLLDSLTVYLNNRDRQQPIIGLHGQILILGLGCITECVRAATHPTELLYLCEVCVCRVSKADIRNHITGSLHRYKYIKARHPNLVSEWEEDCNLSKMAWPLMEKAKMLEAKQGPGHVQVLEVDDTIYQRILSTSENDAVPLINILKRELDGRSETRWEQWPIPSQRIVMFGENQQMCSKNSVETETKTLPSIRPTEAPSVESVGRLESSAASLQDNGQTSHEKLALTETSKSFLYHYKGTKPLIGLCRMIEYQNEDGRTCCFLCHSCRKRINTLGIIDHLTCSSHMMKYLMETRPRQVDKIMADINDKVHVFQSLAKKVARNEGRGGLKVVQAPKRLCELMSSNTYNWCIEAMNKGLTYTDTERWETSDKGPLARDTFRPDLPNKKVVRKITKRKLRENIQTIFNVSLPHTKGSVLLNRTAFSKESHNMPFTYLSPSDPEPLDNCELDFDNQSFAINTEITSELQQEPCSRDAERNFCHYQVGDDNFTNNAHSEYIPETEDTNFYGGKNYIRHHGSRERSHKRFYKEVWQKRFVVQIQSECPSTPVPRTEDSSSYHGCVDSCIEQRDSSTLQSITGIRVEVPREETQEVSFDAAFGIITNNSPNISTWHGSGAS